MGRYNKELILVGSLVFIFCFNAMAAEMLATDEPTPAEPFAPIVLRDCRVDVATNNNVYYNGDVLRLTVKLLNDSSDTVFIGVCPQTLGPEEPVENEVTEVDQGMLDDTDVDVAVIPSQPKVIGVATLTRLGPSPVPFELPDPDATTNADEAPKVRIRPKRFRLPLFGASAVPGHSTRIISLANILIRGPLLEVVEPEPVPGPALAEERPRDVVDEEPREPKDIEMIPAVGRHVPVRPGYYLLDCRIQKICGTSLAQAQKIVQIKQRTPRPILRPRPARRLGPVSEERE
ncbi:MAG: hypothetical protein JSU70_18355 [Phycisphaerales bacterium]|nr:MAG: hypothetical protein JSU70_18355 [Phycisphaerales bacterium]